MKIEFEYCIIFDDNNIEKKWDDNVEGIHSYNSVLKDQVDACWYIMHLPRTIYDLRNIHDAYWKYDVNKAHNIIFLPSSIAKSYEYQNVTLVIYIGDCEIEAKSFCHKNQSLLEYVNISELDNDLLKEHWFQLGIKLNLHKNISSQLRLLNSDEKNSLPLLFIEHYLDGTDDFFENLKGKLKFFSECFLETLNLRADIEAKLDKQGTENNIEELFNQYRETVTLPISVTMPGLAPAQEKNLSTNTKTTFNEQDAIRLVGVHNAIAKDGFFLELSSLQPVLFSTLNEIESACKYRGNPPNNRFIWKKLRKIGKLLYDNMTDEQGIALLRASNIVAFTDFPIGLAILPNSNVPLSCYKSISYRHLTPLPSCIITELSGHSKIYLNKKCKILMIECLDKNLEIRYYSDKYLKDELIEIGYKYESIEVRYEEVQTIADFNKALFYYSDIDILLISAHGAYEDNIAGLCIGDEVLVYESQIENEIPSVVLLSACHVCPRGKGVISIVDSLIRRGASAVLGTYIPIKVDRNALLMKRLLLNIVFTQNGENEFDNLGELWSFVAASNAFAEIVHSNLFVKKWIEEEKRKGVNIEKEFILRSRSRIQIKNTNIYEDTLKVLCEIATDNRIKDNLTQLMISENYFPESLFYCMYGFPENIIFTK